ncbi:MAG: site-specific tyrosine recombinase XerD [Flavobacteriales bacterium TMED191]|nr:MAG: site-specific tyrosine recombinase XerD [Flavobacteriales bacterium TMED191]
MNWKNCLKSYYNYILIERNLSVNSVKAYMNDLQQFAKFNNSIKPLKINRQHILNYINDINNKNINPRTQARILSSIKSFYNFLIFDNKIKDDPCKHISSPKIGSKLPEILTVKEVDLIIKCIDLSEEYGERNRAIIECLYSCGLRVSELVSLKISNIEHDDRIIKVIGKGKKQRIIPLSSTLYKYLKDYVKYIRSKQTPNKENIDIIFLNRRNKKLSRVMIFNIVKKYSNLAGIKKNVSPHTFRHSFATHLVEGGADLRVVQEMLGHANITTTEIYTHLNNQYLREEIINYHPRA